MNMTAAMEARTNKPLTACTDQEIYLALLDIVREQSAARVRPVTGRKLRRLFGSGGFGHAGAGGSHAFADPVCGLSFGYAMNRMDLNVLPGVKTRNLISAVMKEMEERPEA